MRTAASTRRETRDPRGLGGAWVRHQRHENVRPSADLAPFVDRYWTAEWEYEEPYRQLMVPFPQVHLTIWTGRMPVVNGVSSRPITRVLDGRDRVFGIAFRPGGFRPFLGSPVSALTDRIVPAAGIVPGRPDEPVDVPAVERWLRRVEPVADPTAERVAGLVEQVAADPGIARVDQLARLCGCSVRGLQRLFAEYVGIGPKWVIRRYRLREVTERMERGETADWAGLAADLGYADQAHLVRDFAAMFGEPPTHYARRY